MAKLDKANETVKETPKAPVPETVDVTIRRIREKIEPDTSNPRILITKRGVGYYIANK